MFISYNIAELLHLNVVRKGSTAKPTFPPPWRAWEYSSQKSGGTGPQPLYFCEEKSQVCLRRLSVILASVLLLTGVRRSTSGILPTLVS